MSAEQLDNPVAYEQLEDLEDDFEDVELELSTSWPLSAPTHSRVKEGRQNS